MKMQNLRINSCNISQKMAAFRFSICLTVVVEFRPFEILTIDEIESIAIRLVLLYVVQISVASSLYSEYFNLCY